MSFIETLSHHGMDLWVWELGARLYCADGRSVRFAAREDGWSAVCSESQHWEPSQWFAIEGVYDCPQHAIRAAVTAIAGAQD